MEDKMVNKSIKRNEPIQGKVSGILTERELTINIGSDHGVSVGMRFKILANEPIEVRDPETNDKLGIVDREKVRVVASEVKEKFSICKTYVKYATPGLNLSFTFPFAREVHETLKVEDAALPQPLSEEESYVKVGDRVIQLAKEDDE